MKDKKYKRKIVEKLLKYLKSKGAIVIYGARQVGKTTLLKYLIDNYIKENVFYFNNRLHKGTNLTFLFTLNHPSFFPSSLSSVITTKFLHLSSLLAFNNALIPLCFDLQNLSQEK